MTENEETVDSQAVDRRKLLKAAVGTGVAVAAYSAPRVSGVPAYALTTSIETDNNCYAFGWSANNPDGKGWMQLSDQPSTSGPVVGPNGKQTHVYNDGFGTITYCGANPANDWVSSASDHSGPADCSPIGVAETAPAEGRVRYIWDIPKIISSNPTPDAFTLYIELEGCMNNEGAAIFAYGMPAGYGIQFYHSGAPVSGEPSTCGGGTVMTLTDPSNSNKPYGTASLAGPVDLGSFFGQTGFIAGLGGSNCSQKPKDSSGVNIEGKWFWNFDIVPF